MSRVFQALTAEPWAIVPAELQKIAAIVQRHSLPDAAAKGEPEYQKRDYQRRPGRARSGWRARVVRSWSTVSRSCRSPAQSFRART